MRSTRRLPGVIIGCGGTAGATASRDCLSGDGCSSAGVASCGATTIGKGIGRAWRIRSTVQNRLLDGVLVGLLIAGLIIVSTPSRATCSVAALMAQTAIFAAATEATSVPVRCSERESPRAGVCRTIVTPIVTSENAASAAVTGQIRPRLLARFRRKR
jgi:hypothetical protein